MFMHGVIKEKGVKPKETVKVFKEEKGGTKWHKEDQQKHFNLSLHNVTEDVEKAR